MYLYDEKYPENRRIRQETVCKRHREKASRPLDSLLQWRQLQNLNKGFDGDFVEEKPELVLSKLGNGRTHGRALSTDR